MIIISFTQVPTLALVLQSFFRAFKSNSGLDPVLKFIKVFSEGWHTDTWYALSSMSIPMNLLIFLLMDGS